MFEVKVKSDTVFELSWDIKYDLDPRERAPARQIRSFMSLEEAMEEYRKEKPMKNNHNFQLVKKIWVPLPK